MSSRETLPSLSAICTRVGHENIFLKQLASRWLTTSLTVSDPTHERYGNHLSQSEVEKLVTPAAESLALVQEWLEDNAIEPAAIQYSSAKDWVIAALPVKEIEKLLDTKYSVYEHVDGERAVRTSEWSLPQHLHDHIDTIQPTNSFFRTAPKSVNLKPVTKVQHHAQPSYQRQYYEDPTAAQVCNTSGITPLCLRTLYGTIDYVPQVPGKNKVGLNDFLGESNNRSDIHIFLETFRPEAAQAAYDFKFDVINGGDHHQVSTPAQLAAGTDLEGNLDAETILGIDYPTPLIAYTTGGLASQFKADNNTPTDTNEPYLAWVTNLLSQSDSEIAQTISTSYDDDEQTVPTAFAKRVCNEFAQLGARGVSLFFASGDEGVGQNGSCFTNTAAQKPRFLPEFPSTCPYVTAVGATKNIAPEVAAFDARNGFASGGGFSDIFPRPAYQNSAVAPYVASLHGEFSEYYNQKGRAYPDIAAQGQSFITVWNGTQVILDGTSASTPAASAIIALVNDALIAAGRKPLGFLNPWLYGGGYKAFTDITSGSAIGCAGLGSGLGFPTAKGWDVSILFSASFSPRFIHADLYLGCHRIRNAKLPQDLEGAWSCGPLGAPRWVWSLLQLESVPLHLVRRHISQRDGRRPSSVLRSFFRRCSNRNTVMSLLTPTPILIASKA